MDFIPALFLHAPVLLFLQVFGSCPTSCPSTWLASLVFIYFVLQKAGNFQLLLYLVVSIHLGGIMHLHSPSKGLALHGLLSQAPIQSSICTSVCISICSPDTCTRCILNIAPQKDPAIRIPLISQGDRHLNIFLKMVICLTVSMVDSMSYKPQSPKSCPILLATALPFF